MLQKEFKQHLAFFYFGRACAWFEAHIINHPHFLAMTEEQHIQKRLDIIAWMERKIEGKPQKISYQKLLTSFLIGKTKENE